MCVNNLPRVFTRQRIGRSQTNDLLITSPTPHIHYIAWSLSDDNDDDNSVYKVSNGNSRSVGHETSDSGPWCASGTVEISKKTAAQQSSDKQKHRKIQTAELVSFYIMPFDLKINPQLFYTNKFNITVWLRSFS